MNSQENRALSQEVCRERRRLPSPRSSWPRWVCCPAMRTLTLCRAAGSGRKGNCYLANEPKPQSAAGELSLAPPFSYGKGGWVWVGGLPSHPHPPPLRKSLVLEGRLPLGSIL